MGKITLILGGARSGKSSQALCLAKGCKKVAFIATCQGLDKEMRLRIKLHQQSRPKHWRTFEEPGILTKLIREIGNDFDCIIVDCLTLLVSNRILAKNNQKEIIKEIQELLLVLSKKRARFIFVSNEVGLGLVPLNKLGRDFRDIAGMVNRIVAAKADQALFMVSGLPMHIKGKKIRS